jgi:hypothetical protein
MFFYIELSFLLSELCQVVAETAFAYSLAFAINGSIGEIIEAIFSHS